jgi:hypothetical protein
VVANTLASAPRLCRKLPADIISVRGREEVMAVPRVKTIPPALGGLRSVVLSVFFGNLWSAVLSLVMTTIER